MEDSKLWWYLILGAIYFLSKFLKKKKPQDKPQQRPSDTGPDQEFETAAPEQKTPSSIEEILRELSEQSSQKREPEPVPELVTPDPIPKREPTPIETYSREPRPLPSEMENIEAVHADEEIDIVPHKPIERDKPEYKRSKNFALKEKTHELADDVQDVFKDADGARKAFIYGEIFNRRY
ncbi:MAG: hypothetical protein JXQ96_14635 [Cyclobacteriaceae bacterium]